MRHITAAGILGALCWNASGLLLIHMHMIDPGARTGMAGMWLLATLATAITATLAALIDKRDQPHVPVRVSYDLGWQAGYRAAEQKYIRLVAELKGQLYGKGQSPPER